jgi:RimJ/RimL family protein N-acetyltransferase
VGVAEPLPIVTLTGDHVRLEPLALDHAGGLAAAAAVDRRTYGLTWVPDGEAAMRRYISTLLDDHAAARVLPFAQRRLDTGELVGCTRLMEARWWPGRGDVAEIEIGGTWLSAPAQRTGLNTEAKYLLLGHAFETLGVVRVAICTDARNERSRVAVERLGATFEGILRNHRPRADLPTPRPRDSAMYSVIASEWPAVKDGLERRLTGGRPTPA